MSVGRCICRGVGTAPQSSHGRLGTLLGPFQAPMTRSAQYPRDYPLLHLRVFALRARVAKDCRCQPAEELSEGQRDCRGALHGQGVWRGVW